MSEKFKRAMCPHCSEPCALRSYKFTKHNWRRPIVGLVRKGTVRDVCPGSGTSALPRLVSYSREARNAALRTIAIETANIESAKAAIAKAQLALSKAKADLVVLTGAAELYGVELEPDEVTCDACNGEGWRAKELGGREWCARCDGKGKRREDKAKADAERAERMRTHEECSRCDGYGWNDNIDQDCPKCDGSGWVKRAETTRCDGKGKRREDKVTK